MRKKPKKDKQVIIGGIKFTISDSVKDYSNDPVVIKKAEASRKFLKEHGFPDIPKKK